MEDILRDLEEQGLIRSYVRSDGETAYRNTSKGVIALIQTMLIDADLNAVTEEDCQAVLEDLFGKIGLHVSDNPVFINKFEQLRIMLKGGENN